MNAPNLASVKSAPEYLSGHADEVDDLEELKTRAMAYLATFSWFGGTEEEYVGAAFPGILGLFLFRIQPLRPDVDTWLWVGTGDLPPAYLTCDACKNPWEALDGYLGQWKRGSKPRERDFR